MLNQTTFVFSKPLLKTLQVKEKLVLTHYQTSKFRQIQIQSICRRQNKSNQKIEICFKKGRKLCERRRKCWLPAFSPFPTMFSKGSCHMVVKSWDCVVQIQSICRRQNKSYPKIEICFKKGRKPCEKRRKCWLPAFSPFPTMFSKGFCHRVVYSWDCVVKSK